jgi:outer membrane protein OmpA-like peptidoglycan-associated protein
MGDMEIDHDIRGGEKLIFEFEAMDASGQRSVIRSSPIRTDVCFVPQKRDSADLFAQLNLQEFDADSFTSEAKTLLGQIYREWSDLDGYSVRVRVFVSFQGEEEENLIRSEKLALRIRDALVETGISDKLVVFRGEGETDLVSEAGDEYSTYRNNRVRIELLQKR